MMTQHYNEVVGQQTSKELGKKTCERERDIDN